MIRFRVSGPIRLADIPLPGSVAPGPAVPPPRFENATFESFRPSGESQRLACEHVRAFVKRLPGPRRRWPWQASPTGQGLYLDGGYGVGKTHLLAAAYHAAEVERAYLSFQELVHLIGVLGMEAAGERFSNVMLVCIDEFELDDPGNTLIVKRFLEQVFGRGGAVITTSNTPAEAQGQGRFNADDFRREIQGIASRFTAVNITGSDYRRREERPALPSLAELELSMALESGEDASHQAICEFEELLEVLGKLHPIAYRSLLERFELLVVTDLATIATLNDALRFVHFIDQLYNWRVGFRAAGVIDLDELFHPSYRNSAYQRKFERCISRLGELLGEAAATEVRLRQVEGFD